MSEPTTAIVKHDPNASLTLQRVSEGLFQSGLFPNAKNKWGAFSIVEYGHELGIPPMMALRNINIISGQLACNAQLMLTLAMQKGVTYDVKLEGDKGAKILFKRGTASYESSFMEEDAKAAGLLGKDNWKKYPRDMYFWRCVAKGVRRIAPDAVMGLYTAEEITEGAVINVSEVKPTGTAPETQQPPTPEPPPVVDAEVEPDPATLKPGSPLHKKIEASITEAGIDRESFKGWLFEKGKIELDGDHPSLTTMTEKDAQSMMDKWSATVTAYNTWKAKAA